MSVNPIIQEPGNSQSINPYSYVMNNPLGYTDPTGYSRLKAHREKVAERQQETTSKFNASISTINAKIIGSVSSSGAEPQASTNSSATSDKTTIGAQVDINKNDASNTSPPSNSGTTSRTLEGSEDNSSDNVTENSSGQNERDFWDNPGRHLPSVPQGLVDFVAGFGDSLSFNLTKHIRGLADINSVDTPPTYSLKNLLKHRGRL